MPVYRTRKIFEAARGIKCFLNLDAGVTRGRVPGPKAQEHARVQELEGQLDKAHKELARVKEQLSNQEPEQQARNSQPNKMRTYDGLHLPPPKLRPHRRTWVNDDKEYLEAARKEVSWMVENLGLSPESSLLDVGCGPGRIALGILSELGGIREYRGVDVERRYVEWAQRHITPSHPNFQFTLMDLKNDMYNPEGEEITKDFRLPFSEEFDVICLFSVFTHMLTEDVRIYLRQLYRVLHPNGKLFMTANLEDGVPDVESNPIGYRGRQKYNKPLASVRYNREFFENLLDESGFRIEKYDPSLRKQQRALIVSKKSE